MARMLHIRTDGTVWGDASTDGLGPVMHVIPMTRRQTSPIPAQQNSQLNYHPPIHGCQKPTENAPHPAPNTACVVSYRSPAPIVPHAAAVDGGDNITVPLRLCVIARPPRRPLRPSGWLALWRAARREVQERGLGERLDIRILRGVRTRCRGLCV